MTCGIYKITNLVNGKCYVGSSKSIEGRLKDHFLSLRKNQHRNKHLQASWNKYGEASFESGILKVCTIWSLIPWEQKFIDKIKPEYNKSTIAGKVEFTEEVRNKIGKSKQGNHYRLGMKDSAEHRAAISASAQNNQYAKGAIRSPETRSKMSAAQHNRPLSVIEKIRQSMLGKRNRLGQHNTLEHNEKIRLGLQRNRERKNSLEGEIDE